MGEVGSQNTIREWERGCPCHWKQNEQIRKLPSGDQAAIGCRVWSIAGQN